MISRIPPLEAADEIKRNGTSRLLDVRTAAEYATARIEDSVFISMDEISQRMNELDPETHWIVVCHHGYRSMQVAMWLESKGFEQVSNLEGGIERWSLEVDSNVPRY